MAGNLNQAKTQQRRCGVTSALPTRPTARRSSIRARTDPKEITSSTPSTPAGEGVPELVTTMVAPEAPAVVVRSGFSSGRSQRPRGLGGVGCSSSPGPASCPFSPEYVEREYSDVSRCVVSRLHSFDPLGNAQGQLGLLLLRDLQRPCPLQHQRSELLLLVGHTGG